MYMLLFLALWDDPLGDQKDELWENITVEEVLTDDSIEEVHVIPARVTSRSCPTSPVMVRSARSISGREGPVGVSFSLPRRKGLDSDFYNLETLRNRQQARRSDDLGNIRHQRRNPFNAPGDQLGDSAVRDYFTSNEATAESANNVLLLKENYYEKEEEPVVDEDLVVENDNSNNNANKQPDDGDSVDLESQGAKSKSDKSRRKEADDNDGNGATVWRFLSVDDIYLSYWKISVSS